MDAATPFKCQDVTLSVPLSVSFGKLDLFTVDGTTLVIDNKEFLQLWPRVIAAGVPDFESTVAIWISDATINQYLIDMNEYDRLWEEVMLLEPEFEEGTDGFSATLYKDTFTEKMLRNEGLNERQIRAVMWARGREKITNKNYQEINDISKQMATIDLKELVNKNILHEQEKREGELHINWLNYLPINDYYLANIIPVRREQPQRSRQRRLPSALRSASLRPIQLRYRYKGCCSKSCCHQLSIQIECKGMATHCGP